MKKFFTLFFTLFAISLGTHISAEANTLTIDFTVEDNGAIVIPETARFNLFDEQGEWLANEACDVFQDTKNNFISFTLPQSNSSKYKIVPTKGVTQILYNDAAYKIDDYIELDISESNNIKMVLQPLIKPKTGVRANSIVFHFDVLNTGTPIASMARFNLFDKDGQWLANDAVKVSAGGERKTLTFNIPDYYTGDKFYLCPTVGMTSVNYNGTDFEPEKMIEVETYSYVDENNETKIGNSFQLNLTPLYRTPAFDDPDAFGKTATEFVNASGVSSRTNYLIWISKKDYAVSVFLGSKGNWRYVTAFDCSIGKPSTPTITGQFEYYQYQPRWTYPGYYCGPIMRFAAGGYAMHSTLLRYDNTPYDGRLRMKISHGCVRMHPNSIKWLVEYIPLNTRVYITE